MADWHKELRRVFPPDFPRSEVDSVLDMRWYTLDSGQCHRAIASIIGSIGARFIPDLPKNVHLNVKPSKRHAKRLRDNNALWSVEQCLSLGLIERFPASFRAMSVFNNPANGKK